MSTALEDLMNGTRRTLPRKPPTCEYTAPGSETEAIDCWEPATVRHVKDGVTTGVFCDEHTGPAKKRGVKVETF